MNAADRAALAFAADILGRLPDVLTAELRRRGLSQEAAAGQIGVDRQSVNRWAGGRRMPSAPDVGKVFRWLAGGGVR